MSWWRYDSAFAIRWKEPRRFKQLKMKAEIRQAKSKVVLVKLWAGVFCAFIALFFIAWLDAKWAPAGKPRSVALIPVFAASASTLAMAVGLLGIMADARFFPRRVVLARNWMGVLWEAGPRWQYDRIASVRFDTMHMGEQEFRIMVVTSREGGDSSLALSTEVDPQKIIEILRSKGVEVAEGLTGGRAQCDL
jgi:hypothetical protein